MLKCECLSICPRAFENVVIERIRHTDWLQQALPGAVSGGYRCKIDRWVTKSSTAKVDYAGKASLAIKQEISEAEVSMSQDWFVRQSCDLPN